MPYEEFKKKYQEKMFIFVMLIISLSAAAVILFLISLVFDSVLKEMVKEYEWLFVLLFAFVGFLMNRLIEIEKQFLKEDSFSMIELLFYPAALLLVSTVLFIVPSWKWWYIIGVVAPSLFSFFMEIFFFGPLREDWKKTQEYTVNQEKNKSKVL